jgi:hypothetical protein
MTSSKQQFCVFKQSLKKEKGTHRQCCSLREGAVIDKKHLKGITVVPHYSRLGYGPDFGHSRGFLLEQRTLREENCYGYSRISLVVEFFERAKEPTLTRDYCSTLAT